MRQKLKIPIKRKIITKKDIKDIAKYLYSLKNKEKTYFDINIKFNNEIEISSDDLSCLGSRKIEEYEISQIRITYRDSEYKDEIDVYIENFDVFEYSNIEISSSDEERLGSIEHKLAELLGFCEASSKINYLFSHSMGIAVFVGTAMTTTSTMLLINFIKNYNTENNAIYFLAIFVLFALVYYYILKKLFKAYPNIEIDIDNKTNRSKKGRMLILTILTLIIIPLLLNIGYDIIKILLKV